MRGVASRAAGVLLLLPGAAAAYHSPSVRLEPAAGPVEIDGRLDEAAWAEATRLQPLIQVEPIEGAAPSFETDIRITYDQKNLYIGVRCHDPEPGRLIASQMRRDAELSTDDRISIAIDTFHDHRNAFFFQTNPNGARVDALIENSTRFRREWDGIWYAKSRVDASGWTTEIAIPTRTLSFDPDSDAWGFNILRAIRRKNELLRWSSAKQNKSFIDMSEVGDLTNIVGLEQGLGLDVVPRGVVRTVHERREHRSYTRIEPGLDAFYKLTPSVTGALTINTDFSDAPIDPRRVNLTRFDLFFPETRDFFLQDAGIFDFGGLVDENGLAFFSRRIGIAPDGSEIPLRAGAKVTGRVGRLNFGVLDVQMGSHRELESKNLSVARASWNFLHESSAGLIATHGDPVTNGSNTLLGADVRLRTSHFREEQILSLDGWAQRSHTNGVGGGEHAYGLRLAYPNDRWNGLLSMKEIGEHFRPALGFVNRREIREYRGNLRRRFRPLGSWVRTADLTVESRLVTDLGNDLESLEVFAKALEIHSQLGDRITFGWRQRTERLARPFPIFDGVVIPRGRYDFGQLVMGFLTSGARPVAVGVDVSAGDFFSGDIVTALAVLQLRPSRHLFVSLEYEENHVDLPEGDFTTRVGRVRVDVAFSPDVTIDVFLQFDNVSDTLGWNARFRWIITPGSELAVVWNQGFDTRDRGFRGLGTELSSKLAWTFRF